MLFLSALALEERNGSLASYNGSLLVPPTNLTRTGSGASEVLTAFNFAPEANYSATVGSSGADMAGFDATSGVIWGRWINGSLTQSINPPQLSAGTSVPATGIHFMYGSPTPDSVLASRTGILQYNDIGGTTPTNSNGQTALSFSFGPINVNFTNRNLTITSINMQFASSSWTFSNLQAPLTFTGNGVTFDANLVNVGSCEGSGSVCSATQGANTVRADFSGGFFTNSGNYLGLNFMANSGAQTAIPNASAGAVRLYRCTVCP